MWKNCNCCVVEWNDHREFLEDKSVRYLGMQLLLDVPGHICMYYFLHHPCETTLAVNVQKFAAMLDEPIPEKILAGTDPCEKHCARMDDFLDCENECHNAPFRRLANKVLSNMGVAPPGGP